MLSLKFQNTWKNLKYGLFINDVIQSIGVPDPPSHESSQNIFFEFFPVFWHFKDSYQAEIRSHCFFVWNYILQNGNIIWKFSHLLQLLRDNVARVIAKRIRTHCSYAKIWEETNFHSQEFPRSGWKAEGRRRKKKRRKKYSRD